MSKIKVAELFYSIQGEGRFMGVPSVFLRTFGCNFQCKDFGRPKNTIPASEKNNPEVDTIASNVDSYPTYKDLPLVFTGCDSYASWDPRFKHLSPVMKTEDIAAEICNILPFGHWKDEHLVITGGEPLLGWQRAYPDLLTDPKMVGLKEITFETNGTQPLSDDLHSFLYGWFTRGGIDRERLTFSVSPKLSVSGEKKEDAIRPEIIKQYQAVGHTYLKFVIASEEDCSEALEAIEAYRQGGFVGPVYLMPVGGIETVYALNNKNVALLAMKHGLRYSDRLQVPLFKNEWGT